MSSSSPPISRRTSRTQAKNFIDTLTTGNAFPRSRRIYLQGTLPSVRVPMREIQLSPTKIVDNGKTQYKDNDPVLVYDTAGPYGDLMVPIDVRTGLAQMRAQ